MKVFVVRRSYGDFDTYYSEPVAASLDKNQAEAEMAVLNEKLKIARNFYNEYIIVSKGSNRVDECDYSNEGVKEASKILPDFSPYQNEYFLEEVELYGD